MLFKKIVCLKNKNWLFFVVKMVVFENCKNAKQKVIWVAVKSAAVLLIVVVVVAVINVVVGVFFQF